MQWQPLLLLAPAVLSSPVASEAVPDASIISTTHGGIGCEQSSKVNIALADDNQSFTVALASEIVASIGPLSDIIDSRKNCQISIQLRYPAGYQFAVTSGHYYGRVGLESGTSGLQKATYYFAGSTTQTSTEAAFTGPTTKGYTVSNSVQPEVWSPCGEAVALNVNSQVLVDSVNSKAKGFVSTGSSGNGASFKLGIQWKKC